MREVVWLGDSKKQLKKLPKEVKRSVGGALQAAQFGRKADNVKPFTHVGSGVFEISASHRTNAYRAIYAVQIGKKIYVLHVFQKKSKSGAATPKPDVDLIISRYKQAEDLAKDESE